MRLAEKVSISCFNSGTRRGSLIANPMTNHGSCLLTVNKWGKYNIAWLTVTVQRIQM